MSVPYATRVSRMMQQLNRMTGEETLQVARPRPAAEEPRHEQPRSKAPMETFTFVLEGRVDANTNLEQYGAIHRALPGLLVGTGRTKPALMWTKVPEDAMHDFDDLGPEDAVPKVDDIQGAGR